MIESNTEFGTGRPNEQDSPLIEPSGFSKRLTESPTPPLVV
ncbi:unnamed protein product [Schistosoma mattheei]|uniref:Uncharacterized protein n=1 Tax=Schistosoma mattheei TaxID=31246 RepID=A0A3P8EEN6_9TREM|nr:unnamed protein product [Schistosoma mattheei]